jgi:hypothetical protein
MIEHYCILFSCANFRLVGYPDTISFAQLILLSSSPSVYRFVQL